MEFTLQPSPALRSSQNVYDFGTESDWQPTISFVTPGNVSMSYVRRRGYSLQLGRWAFVAFDVTGTITHSSASGSLTISGMPFNCMNVSFDFIGPIYQQGIVGGANLHQANVAFNGSAVQDVMYIYLSSAETGSTNTAAQNHVSTGQSLILKGSIWYMVDRI